MKEVDCQNNILLIRFSGGAFKESLDLVKSLKGSNFVISGKYWTAPATEDNIERLKTDGWWFTSTASALLFKKEPIKIHVDEKKLEGFFPYQIEGVKWLEKSGGLGIVGDEMGCISGEAIVTINRSRTSKKYTLEEAYKFYSNQKNATLKIRGLKNNRFSLFDLKGIYYKGEKEVYELQTESGRTIKSTLDHKFLTKTGKWLELSELRILDEITVDGEEVRTIPKYEKIVSITKIGFEDVYDVSVEGEYHNFVANGFVVHNCGKTAQAIGYFKLHQELRPILIVCPASVKLNWAKEIERWSEEKSIQILFGTAPKPLSKSKWIIANYDILVQREKRDKSDKIAIQGWVDELIKIGIKGIVIDENQFISNDKAIRTKAVKYLKKNIKGVKFIGLSGTPIRNRPSEFFTILNLIAPSIFPNRWKYLNRYCGPKFNGFGWSFDGATNIEELHELIAPYMIRRLKSEVLTQLPPKIKSIVPLEVESVAMKNYEDAEGEFKEWLKKNISSFAVKQSQMEKLKQLAYLSKRNSVMQWIEDFLSSGQKLVVYVFHHIAADDICNKFKKSCVRIDGGTSAEDRQKAIDRFQNDPSINLFVGQIIAAGVGIDGLQNVCSDVAFIEFTFTPSDHSQAEDRLHRIRKDGNYENQITAYYLIAPGTIEDKIVNIILRKHDSVKRILDGKGENFFKGESLDITKDILKQYGEE